MKKNLLILLCIIFPIASNAQDVFESSEQLYPSPRTYRNYVKPGVHPYLRTGVSCNDYTSVQVRGIKSVWGFAAEAGVDFFFTDTYFGFKPTLRYITKGANVSWAQGDPANTKIYQQTLELPLDVTMNFKFGDDVIFQVGMFVCHVRRHGHDGNKEIRHRLRPGLLGRVPSFHGNYGRRGWFCACARRLCRARRQREECTMALQPFFLSDAWL